MVERIFWSIPLSLAISTIGAVVIGKFLALTAVVALLLASAVLCVVLICREGLQLRRSGMNWNIGWRPLGGKALIAAAIWVAVAALSLVDLQKNNELFMSLTIFDHGPRVSLTESVLRTGIPPANPFYWYKQPAATRYYYFWYVDCAAVTKMAHLPARSVFIAGCVWAGFLLAALAGLYLKHFLEVGVRLRKQFLLSVSLFMITGLDICVVLWGFYTLHRPLPGYLEVWNIGQITSWLDSVLWVPHHVASMVCCMLAFLLAWMAGKDKNRKLGVSGTLIALALASSFGLSVYVAIAFFFLMLMWAPWQIFIERKPLPALILGAGGAGAAVLLIPYLWELTHTSSGMHGGSVFAFAVREMIPPEGLLAWPTLQHLATGHPFAARNLANLVLLAPGYAVELGFYLAIFLIFLIPAWRGRTPLTPAQRSLTFLAASTLVLISFVRSGVLESNDFGWRGALPMQFALLLLASEVRTSWIFADRKINTPSECAGLPHHTPNWLKSAASFALIIGILSTAYQALILRFTLPLFETKMRIAQDPGASNLSHNAYISSIGYAKLNASIPEDAIVQPNPAIPNPYWIDWIDVDFIGMNHQSVIGSDQLWCWSEFGGDPKGCPAMAAAIDSLFNGATAEQARTTCRQYGIQYLVTRIYDPAWKDRNGWVWTLKPAVSDNEFRALDCRE